MTFDQRIRNLMYYKEPEELVYSLSMADILDVIRDNLSDQQLNLLTDEELDLLIQGTAKSVGNIDWYEWAEAGFDFHIAQILSNK